MCQVIWQQLAGDGELSHMAGNIDRLQLLLLLLRYKTNKVTGYEKKNINKMLWTNWSDVTISTRNCCYRLYIMHFSL